MSIIARPGSIELAKICLICSQQYFLHESPGLVCMDCAYMFEDYGIRTCIRCGMPIGHLGPRNKRCEGCRDKQSPVMPTLRCPVCGIEFEASRMKQRSCSNDCAQKYFKKHLRVAIPEPWNERRKANYHKRRALKRKLPADNIRPRDVYERDGWICQICYEPVDASVKWPDPKSPSLDHTIPLSKGGHHVWENVALAHLDCNVRKGDRVSVE